MFYRRETERSERSQTCGFLKTRVPKTKYSLKMWSMSVMAVQQDLAIFSCHPPHTSSWRWISVLYGVLSLLGLLPGSPLWLSLFSTLMGLNFAPFFFCCCRSPCGSLWKSGITNTKMASLRAEEPSAAPRIPSPSSYLSSSALPQWVYPPLPPCDSRTLGCKRIVSAAQK